MSKLKNGFKWFKENSESIFKVMSVLFLVYLIVLNGNGFGVFLNYEVLKASFIAVFKDSHEILVAFIATKAVWDKLFKKKDEKKDN